MNPATLAVPPPPFDARGGDKKDGTATYGHGTATQLEHGGSLIRDTAMFVAINAMIAT